MDIRSLVIRLGFGLDSRGADAADKRVANLSKSADGLANKFKLAAGALAGVGAYKIAAELRESVDASIGFGREMGNISSLIGGNKERTQELADASQQMAMKFGRSSKDITGGLYEVISTFGDTKDVIEQTNIAIKIGAAGAGTTADGISLLGAVTKAYGDTSAATMQKVSDLGFQTVNLGKVTLPELASSIQQATPLAAALGVKLEELFAIQATASGVTGSGSEVFTQMNSAMKSLMERTPEMEKAFKKAFAHTGVKTAKDAVGKFGLTGALQKVIATTNGSQEQIGKLFGRIEGLKLGLALTGNQAGDFAEKMKAMQNVAGATDTAFKAQTTGLAKNAFELDKLNTRGEILQQTIGDRLAGTMINSKKDLMTFAEVALGGIATGFDNATDASDRFNASLKGGQEATQTGSLAKLTSMFGNVTAAIGEKAAGAALIGASYAGDYLAGGPMGWFEDAANPLSEGSRQRAADAEQRAHERSNIRVGTNERVKAFSLAAFDPEAAANAADLRRRGQSADAEIQQGRAAFRAAHGGIGTQADVVAAAKYAQTNNIQMKITVPEGSEAASVARIHDQAVRQFVDSIHDQAARSYGAQP